MAKTPKRLKNARKRHARSCEGKQRYASAKAARTAERAMREKKGWRRITAYECSQCGGWHLGTSSR